MSPKGKTPWNKGLKMSDELRKKLSEAHLKNPTRYWLGKKRSFPNRKKPKPFSEEHRKNLSKALKGKNTWSRGRKSKYTGRRHHFWKDGRSNQKGLKRSLEMKHAAYREWRRLVYERDKFTCKDCGKRGGRLNAHHIKPYGKYPGLRLAVSNGITLCHSCHRKTVGKEHLFEKKYFAILKKRV